MGETERGTIGIIGAGVMGRGIAQVAVMQGFDVVLTDISDAALTRARLEIQARLKRRVDKGHWSEDEHQAALSRLNTEPGSSDWSHCEMVLEAVVEDAAIKVETLRAFLSLAPHDALIATNTSSLSVTAIGRRLQEPDRTLGFHFFNPAPVQPLVEIVRTDTTGGVILDEALAIAKSLGKTPVLAADRPGFIVNRVARPFYLEAWRILEEGIAGVDDIDETVRRLGGFRMGPFELMDFIGQDLSLSVTQSVWEGFDRASRFAPCHLQREMVAAGLFGRSTEHGAYDYTRQPPRPAVDLLAQPLVCSKDLTDATLEFVERATDGPADTELEAMIFSRILIAIINEAYRALEDEVAAREDIDTAMRLGPRFPQGPLEWSDRIGLATCRRLLMLLDQQTADDRFTPAGELAVD